MSARQPFDAGPLADLEERKAIFAVLDSFRQYRRQTHFSTTHRRRQNFYALPKLHQQLLISPPFNFLDWLSRVDDAIDENADIADAILSLALKTFDLAEQPEEGDEYDWHQTCRPGDLSKAHSTIRQFWRDWSNEGFAAEVKPVLDLVLDDLTMLFAQSDNSYVPSLLLPGAGLGRLLFELCLAGYNAEGNEISYHQLLGSNFILNYTSYANQYRLFPSVSTFTNQTSRSSQLASVTIPEFHPSTKMLENSRAKVRKPGEMSMSAGDFITSYSTEASMQNFDGVVTVYFIDTAPNLIRYIETVRNCLIDGGIWINLGPLLWHFDDRFAHQGERHADKNDVQVATRQQENGVTPFNTEDAGIGETGSFELTAEEVIALLKKMGFEMLKNEILPTGFGGYIQDPESMMQNRYRCNHWVARKLSNYQH